MAANDTQVGGDHYKGGAIEHWDIVVQHDLDYFQAQIIKYTMRWRKKGGIQDLEKAQHFLAKYIELAKNAAVAHPSSLSAKYVRLPAGGSEKVAGQKVRAARGKK